MCCLCPEPGQCHPDKSAQVKDLAMYAMTEPMIIRPSFDGESEQRRASRDATSGQAIGPSGLRLPGCRRHLKTDPVAERETDPLPSSLAW